MAEFLKTYSHTPSKEELDSSLYITWAGHTTWEGYINSPPELLIASRILADYKIVLVIKGKGLLTLEDKEFEVKAGDLFILFPGVKHLYRADPEDPWEFLWVSFNGRACGSIMDLVIFTHAYPIIHGVSSNIIIQLLTNIIFELENDVSDYALKATGFLYLFFSELIPYTKKISEQQTIKTNENSIKKALAYIDVNYHQEIGVDTLSRYVNFSRSHFSRLFKKEVNLTVPEYLNKVRIQKAKTLLTGTDLSVGEVARSVGFKDPFYFSKIFKDIEGQSPSFYKIMGLSAKK
jgi:AraC-like DNA-binding protein